MSWITLRTTTFHWEAELMQQILAAYQIPARVLDLGSSPYMGGGSPAALQVRPQDQWTALFLLSPIDADTDEPDELL